MRRAAVCFATLLLAIGCTSSSDDADVEALAEERVEAAPAERDAAVAVADSAPSEPIASLLLECAEMSRAQRDRLVALSALSFEAAAVVEAYDWPEFRRLYRRFRAADDEIVAFDAEIVGRCEAVLLSTPATASAWHEVRDLRAETVAIHADIRAICREIHDVLGMDIDDC